MQSLFDMLDQEWAKLARDPVCTNDLADICRDVGARSLGELHSWIRSAPETEADRVLAPLAARARGGSGLAARVLLQLLMPGTVRLATSWWALGDRDERAAAAVAAVYGRIRHYPIEQRPNRIAANVLLDAEKDLRRAASRVTRDAQQAVCVDPLAFPIETVQQDRHPSDELAELLDEAVSAGRVRPDDAELITATRIGGRRLAEMTCERGATLRTLQWRRRCAEAALVGAGAVA